MAYSADTGPMMNSSHRTSIVGLKGQVCSPHPFDVLAMYAMYQSEMP